jgi:outer membrane protein TolC
MSNSRRVSACVLLFAAGCLAQSNSPVQPELDLSLEKVIELATSPHGDANLQLALESEKLSFSRYIAARSLLLPTLDGSVAEQNQTVNPRALGLRFQNPAFTIPNEVGPFYTFDARARLNQNLLSLSDIRRWQAAHEDMQAAKSDSASVRERVAGSVARLYAAALRADAQVAASNASVGDAEALRDLAIHRAAVGEGTELEAARAKLNVARNQQHKLAAETDRTRSQLDLIKALNLGWDTTLHLTSKLDGSSVETLSVAEYVEMALKTRADFKVEEDRVKSAQLNQNAARLERMPSLVGYADYGILEGVQTHTVGAQLRVPIFNSGQVESHEVQATALMRQEQIRQKELKSEVELEVRKALAAITSTMQQTQVAEQAIHLAEEELGRARRRFEAGVTNSVEVMDAQTQLEIARNDRVAALFDYANARIDLAQATGTITKISF